MPSAHWKTWSPSLWSGVASRWSDADLSLSASSRDEPEERDVDIAECRDNKSVLNADEVGEMAFGQRKKRATYDGSHHKA